MWAPSNGNNVLLLFGQPVTQSWRLCFRKEGCAVACVKNEMLKVIISRPSRAVAYNVVARVPSVPRREPTREQLTRPRASSPKQKYKQNFNHQKINPPQRELTASCLM